jgi:hypothetical protein
MHNFVRGTRARNDSWRDSATNECDSEDEKAEKTQALAVFKGRGAVDFHLNFRSVSLLDGKSEKAICGVVIGSRFRRGEKHQNPAIKK